MKEPATHRPAGMSLPSTESSPGQGREAGENWFVLGGDRRPDRLEEARRETQLEKAARPRV